MSNAAMHTRGDYPTHENALRRLVDQHRRLPTEPLHLAIYFDPQRDDDDVFLFELIGDFGGGAIDEDRELFEFTYGSTPGFRIPDGRFLHLVLTNPQELDQAMNEEWPGVTELARAIRAGRATKLFSDEIGDRFWGRIQ